MRNSSHTKRLFALALLLLFAICREANAQLYQIDTVRFAVGIRGGVGSTSISFQPYQNRDGKIGFAGGITFNVSAHKFLGMQTGVNFLRTGYTTTEFTPRKVGDPNWIGKEIEAAQSFLAIPLLLQLQFAISIVTFRISGGGFFDYLLEEKMGFPGQIRKLELPMGAYNRFGAGVCWGGAVGIDTRVGEFYVEFRADDHLTDLYNRDRIPKASEPSSHIHSQTIGVGYLYKFQWIKQRPMP